MRPRVRSDRQAGSQVASVYSVRRTALLLIGLMLLPVGALCTAPAATASTSAQIQDLTFSRALEALAAVVPEAIVAEPCSDRRRLRQPLRLDEPARAWEQVNEAFDMHVTRYPGVVSLSRRFSDSVDALNLPVAELAETLAPLPSLMEPFVPYPLDERYEQNKVAFLQSITSSQASRMRAGRFPFRDLTPEQQRRWLQVNSAAAYSSDHLDLARAAHVFGRWGEGRLKWEASSQGSRYLSCRWPGGSNGLRAGWIIANEAETAVERVFADPLPAASPLASEASTAAKWPASFRRIGRPLRGEIGLTELLRALGEPAGATVTVPPYAGSRRLLVFGRAPSLAALLPALQDVHGWETRYARRKAWVLARPRFIPARDVRDLHTQLRRALRGPVERLLSAWSRGRKGLLTYDARRAVVRQAVGEPSTLPPDGVAPDELPPIAQQALTEVVLFVSRAGYEKILSSSEPRWRVIAPERGSFRLEGGALHFYVPRPDGSDDLWGYADGGHISGG